jgi:hypothetical protein
MCQGQIERRRVSSASDGAAEAMLFLILLIVNPFEFFEVFFHAGIEVRSLRIAQV